MTKVGRNTPCPCGSGRKYKHCCGQLRSTLPPEVSDALRIAIRKREAAEEIRRRDQGHGRHIIHSEINGARVVAVGERIYWSTKWRFFSDFLVDFLGQTLLPLPPEHPVISWHSRLREHAVGSGVSTAPFGGHVASLLYLAYALYLIAHHDRMPEPLLKRLRRPASSLPAVYETFVAAAFALTGHSIASTETGATSQPTGEFTATSRASGKTYSVEAKRKDAWTHPYNGSITAAFVLELQNYVRSRFRRAARKRLANPVYWIELSIVGLDTDAFRKIRAVVQGVLREEEGHLLGGEPPDPAYVFVTSHGHLADEDTSESAVFGMLEPFRLPDFPRPGLFTDPETVLAAHDTHRDITSVIRSLSEVSRIPASFDGVAPELVRADGTIAAPLQIGDSIALPDESGAEIVGTIEDVTSMGADEAWVIARTGEGKRQIWTVPLSPEEVAASRVHGDAVFGKSHSPPPKPHADILTHYDRFRDMFADYPRESLLRQLSSHPDFASFRELQTEALRTRLARETVKTLFYMGKIKNVL